MVLQFREMEPSLLTCTLNAEHAWLYPQPMISHVVLPAYGHQFSTFSILHVTLWFLSYKIFFLPRIYFLHIHVSLQAYCFRSYLLLSILITWAVYRLWLCVGGSINHLSGLCAFSFVCKSVISFCTLPLIFKCDFFFFNIAIWTSSPVTKFCTHQFHYKGKCSF